MRVLYLIGQMSYGGSERQLYELVNNIDRNKHQIAVAVWNSTPDTVYQSRLNESKIPLFLPNYAWPSWRKILWLRELIESYQPHILHSWSFFTNFIAQLASLGNSTLPVGSIRGSIAHSITCTGSFKGIISAKWPMHMTYNSMAVANEANCIDHRYRPRHVHFLPNGLSKSDLPEYTVPNTDPFRIIGVGSLLVNKNWSTLIQAVLTLRELGESVSLEMFGDGPERGNLSDLIEQHNSADVIQLKGISLDIHHEIAKSSVLVHPSLDEGMPNAVMEAMAVGRAVVATSVGDIPLLVEHGVTGFLFSPGDVHGLVELLIQLIHNPQLVLDFGKRGRDKVLAEYDYSITIDQLFDYYQKLLTNAS